MKAKDIAIAILENPEKTSKQIAAMLGVSQKRVVSASHYYGYKTKKHECSAVYEVYGRPSYERRKLLKETKLSPPVHN